MFYAKSVCLCSDDSLWPGLLNICQLNYFWEFSFSCISQLFDKYGGETKAIWFIVLYNSSKPDWYLHLPEPRRWCNG